MSKIDMSQLVTAEDKAEAELAASKTRARAELLTRIDRLTEEVTGTVPLAEKLSWSLKESAARSILNETAAPMEAALIADEAKMTGESTAGLAGLIVRNADQWRAMIAGLTGVRRKADAAIAGATTPSDAEAALATGLDEAETVIRPR